MMSDVEVLTALSDVQVVALTLWGEARGEPVEGKIGVANVIRNRMFNRREGAKAVCLAAKQFSCWTDDGSLNHQRLMDEARRLLVPDLLHDDAVLRECLFIAQGILGGALRDNTNGSQHYLTLGLYQSEQAPAWTKAMHVVAELGTQAFLLESSAVT